MGKGLMSFFNTPILHHSTCDIAGTFDKRIFGFLLIIVPLFFSLQ